jgi:glycine dehydrogenase
VNSFPDSTPFADRHLGPSAEEVEAMLASLGSPSFDAFIREVVPADLLRDEPLALPPALNETEALAKLHGIFGKNANVRSCIGRGYYGTVTPPVIQRCILENPGWYTAYTPYQAEISQGRLEALLNYQTLICDLTALPVANASLLDEATAAAEAMALAAGTRVKGKKLLVSDACFSQTIDVVRTRAEPLGIEVIVDAAGSFDFAAAGEELIGVLLQYPGESGGVDDLRDLAAACKAAGGVVIVAADLLGLVLLEPPGRWGADIVVGSAQRFGVPMGFGGPPTWPAAMP